MNEISFVTGCWVKYWEYIFNRSCSIFKSKMRRSCFSISVTKPTIFGFVRSRTGYCNSLLQHEGSSNSSKGNSNREKKKTRSREKRKQRHQDGKEDTDQVCIELISVLHRSLASLLVAMSRCSTAKPSSLCMPIVLYWNKRWQRTTNYTRRRTHQKQGTEEVEEGKEQRNKKKKKIYLWYCS